jgi:hypothetical protein
MMTPADGSVSAQLVDAGSLDALGGKINDAHDRIEEAFHSCIEHARDAGQNLQLVKAELAHGDYKDWVEENCRFSPRTASVYLRIAKEWPNLGEAKRQRAADLSLRGVIKLLAAPKDEVEAKPLPAQPTEIEGPTISLAEVNVTELIKELETRAWSEMEEGLLCLVRKLADATDREIIIRDKGAPITADSNAPETDESLTNIPDFLDHRKEAVG